MEILRDSGYDKLGDCGIEGLKDRGTETLGDERLWDRWTMILKVCCPEILIY